MFVCSFQRLNGSCTPSVILVSNHQSIRFLFITRPSIWDFIASQQSKCSTLTNLKLKCQLEPKLKHNLTWKFNPILLFDIALLHSDGCFWAIFAFDWVASCLFAMQRWRVSAHPNHANESLLQWTEPAMGLMQLQVNHTVDSLAWAPSMNEQSCALDHAALKANSSGTDFACLGWASTKDEFDKRFDKKKLS